MGNAAVDEHLPLAAPDLARGISVPSKVQVLQVVVGVKDSKDEEKVSVERDQLERTECAKFSP